MRFLALDPSSRQSGWAIFEGEGLLDMGVITYVKGSYGGRFLFLEAELCDLWMFFGFTELAYEGGSWGKFKVPALQVAIQTVRSWCKSQKIPFFVYAPTAIKRGVTGNYKASKAEVARVIYLQFPDLPQGLSTHVTDSIAVGLVHIGWGKIREAERKENRDAKGYFAFQEGL